MPPWSHVQMRTFLNAILARVVLIPLFTTVLLIVTVSDCLWRLRRRSRNHVSRDRAKLHVTVIVTFYNANWCRSHLTPIALAENVGQVTAVVDGPTSAIPGVEYLFPPSHLVRVFGRIFAKYLVLLRVALTRRSDVIIGYFLVPNGLCALLTARLLGRSAVYQNTVGPTEIIGGGVLTDNKILERLRWRSWTLEQLTFAAVRRFDAVVVRGQRGIEYLNSRCLTLRPEVIVGSVDCERFSPGRYERCYDLITVARLVEIKQLDRILQVVRRLRHHRPDVSAVIVGDGPLLHDLRRQADALGVRENVSFLGRVNDVEKLLARARVFILTSRMEGLSIALAEAMACGVPVVVSDVGELGELVENGVTGWRVAPDDVDGYAERVLHLLESPGEWQRLSAAARHRVLDHNSLNSVALRWSSLLEAVVRDRDPICHSDTQAQS